MNVFIVGSPLETAMALDNRRLMKQIIEAQVMLDAIRGKAAWKNHPCTLQYREHARWLQCYTYCLMHYKDANLGSAVKASKYCEMMKPPFHTEEFFNQMKRRLYTKDSNHYKQWADLGTSEENWYWSPSEEKIIKYVNGKRQN